MAILIFCYPLAKIVFVSSDYDDVYHPYSVAYQYYFYNFYRLSIWNRRVSARHMPILRILLPLFRKAMASYIKLHWIFDRWIIWTLRKVTRMSHIAGFLGRVWVGFCQSQSPLGHQHLGRDSIPQQRHRLAQIVGFFALRFVQADGEEMSPLFRAEERRVQGLFESLFRCLVRRFHPFRHAQVVDDRIFFDEAALLSGLHEAVRQ